MNKHAELVDMFSCMNFHEQECVCSVAILARGAAMLVGEPGRTAAADEPRGYIGSVFEEEFTGLYTGAAAEESAERGGRTQQQWGDLQRGGRWSVCVWSRAAQSRGRLRDETDGLVSCVQF